MGSPEPLSADLMLFILTLSAILTSLTATCKRLRLDPFAYLRDLFDVSAAIPKAARPSCFPTSGRQPANQPLYPKAEKFFYLGRKMRI